MLDPDPGPLARVTDQRIRIRTKISRIRNTAYYAGETRFFKLTDDEVGH